MGLSVSGLTRHATSMTSPIEYEEPSRRPTRRRRRPLPAMVVAAIIVTVFGLLVTGAVALLLAVTADDGGGANIGGGLLGILGAVITLAGVLMFVGAAIVWLIDRRP